MSTSLNVSTSSIRRKAQFAVLIVLCLGGGLLWRQSPLILSSIFAGPDAIRELGELPVGAIVHLRGVVTYADPAAKRFWIQDESGAIAVQADPVKYGLGSGSTVNITGEKTHPYNPLEGFTSVELKPLAIVTSRAELPLPTPAPASLKTLPTGDKIGVLIQMQGIIRSVAPDDLGRVMVVIGEPWRELRTTVDDKQGSVLARLLNRKVRVVGVSESSYDDNGYIINSTLWIQHASDIHLEDSSPPQSPLYSLRELYLNSHNLSGYSVRFRGQVASHLAPNSLLLEDQWGALSCTFDGNTNLAIGAAVEVTGFPVIDGLRVDLTHCSAKEIPAEYMKEAISTKLIQALTSVASIRNLPPKEADSALPTRVTAVVTYNDPDWRQLFMQDSTGGIFVKYSGTRVPLQQGQRVTVIGVTNAGNFAPVIVAPKFIIDGKGRLPKPISVSATAATRGLLDSQFVEVNGVIHPLKPNAEPSHITFDLFSPFGRIGIYANPSFVGKDQLPNLVDATVRVRGVFGTVFNSLGQLVGYQLSISSIKDLQVVQAADPDPFRKAALPIASLLAYNPKVDFNHRIKVKGSVTMLGRGYFYLQDATGGIQVQGDPQGLRIADKVDAVGYATAEGSYSPALTDATFRVIGSNAPVSPVKVTAEQAAGGNFDSQLISLDGRLLNIADSPNGKILFLQSGIRTIQANIDDNAELGKMPSLELGSILRLTGICSVQINKGKLYLLLSQQPNTFTILLRSSRDIELLHPAPWWTAQHAIIILGASVVIIVVISGWGTFLRRRVRKQMVALEKARQKTQAVRELVSVMQGVTLRKDFSSKVAATGDDEIALLGAEFNKMMAELNIREIAKQRAEEKLQFQALTDELTGLPNRRLLSDRLAHTLAVATRERNIVAVLYIDLDGFKLVNDSLGHMVGDILLGQVAGRLQSRIRQSDTLARLGGDEFTVVLTKLACRGDAGVVGKSLLETLSRPFLIENHDITISASIGISLFPEDGADGVDLLQQADSAMYAAKRNGKNQMMYFTAELGSLVRERLSLENQLRGAIARGEIAIHYQPEFDIVSGKLIRFEALARWTHPTLGTIPPSKFIPIAEESGLIVPFGAYIMERACADAVSWQTISPDPVQVAVNVSSLQFSRDTFVQEVKEVLSHTGLKPNLLQLELTESVMLSGAERAAEVMTQLRQIGISIAIDDFGTGYSCFSYLPRLPFNALKIDRSFVKELDLRPETKAMVQSLVTLAHNLEMQVIVEGIETPEQLAMIKNFGGNEVQGYLLGRPTPDPAAQLFKMRARVDSTDLGEADLIAE